MITRRRAGGDRGSDFQIVIRSMGGTELLTAHAAPSTRATQLKDFVATELGLFSFGFDLFTADGSKLEGAHDLRQYPVENAILELSMVKRTLPKTSSSNFLQIQSSRPADAQPTFQGRQRSAAATFDILWPRLGVLALVLCFVYFCDDVDSIVRLLVVCTVYLIEALGFNPTARALRNLTDLDSLVGYIAQIKESRPIPKIEVDCYHWETHFRTVTDKEGNSRTESYQEKVHTQKITEPLPVMSWTDDSGDVAEGVACFPLLQIHFEICWQAGDEETVLAHERARQALHQRAETLDSHHDFTEFLHLRIVGNESELPRSDMMCCTTESRPVWLGWRQYVLASLFGLSWPYRWWLAQDSIKGDFVFSKNVLSHNRVQEDGAGGGR